MAKISANALKKEIAELKLTITMLKATSLEDVINRMIEEKFDDLQAQISDFEGRLDDHNL